jgi:hypothetical protein
MLDTNAGKIPVGEGNHPVLQLGRVVYESAFWPVDERVGEDGWVVVVDVVRDGSECPRLARLVLKLDCR